MFLAIVAASLVCPPALTKKWVYLATNLLVDANVEGDLALVSRAKKAGYNGIVSYVESTNFDSLKSCFRMGYFAFGTVYVVKAFGRYYGFSTPGCRKYAFRVARVAGSSPPSLIFGK